MRMDKNGTASNEYMHESIKKDAVKYDLPPEEIITALADDNEQLQAKNKRLIQYKDYVESRINENTVPESYEEVE